MTYSGQGQAASYLAIIDTWDAAGYELTGTGPRQETQLITDVPDPQQDTTHITVERLDNQHTGPFPIIQAGEKGQLIAEWYEYTPSSGTDIQVTIPSAETTLA